MTLQLAHMQEAEGKIDEAAATLQEIAVETFGSMEKREKAEFLLEQVCSRQLEAWVPFSSSGVERWPDTSCVERWPAPVGGLPPPPPPLAHHLVPLQVRLTLAQRDFVKAGILAGKMNKKALDEVGFEDIRLKHYELLVGLHTVRGWGGRRLQCLAFRFAQRLLYSAWFCACTLPTSHRRATMPWSCVATTVRSAARVAWQTMLPSGSLLWPLLQSTWRSHPTPTRALT